MSTPVLMPQMGESIAEGTVVRWIKKVGDHVDRDEPLFEISTDKVDAEIPSPAAGVLSEIRVKEGETVAVNSVVATIGDAAERGTEAPPPQSAGAAAALQGRDASARGTEAPPPQSAGAAAAPQGRDASARGTEAPPPQSAGAAAALQGRDASTRRADAPPPPRLDDDPRKSRSSPLVRKIAKEHDVDITAIAGTGVSGRVTKQDILGYLEHRPAELPAPARPAGHVPAFKQGEAVEIVPLGVMRKKIAEHMVLSRRTSAHVHSVFEVNFSRVAQLREQKKAAYERDGVKLTYLTFIARAVVGALREYPIINASLDGDNIVYKKDVNLGVAVALDWGLIVPVVRHADEKNLLGLGRAIADLAARARAKQLKPEEVQGGTFTITNPGIFGAQLGMPIINQPQVAILGVGAIEKRAVVADDAIAIRPMGYLTLGYDHRLIDGAVADQFLAKIKSTLEQFDPTWV
jgi:pyruvate dehydrogenase E2 component (dihydrolipoamide acetyltransferase)